ncbi:hypothetical protein [Pedobacter hartonius]|uniref:hypothetical protein n=1 Tax=Pedobacter hartonius TaxID=425514 RepID=UPI0011152E4D|nr:hypothetical protein [Pedobacter hartonius]
MASILPVVPSFVYAAEVRNTEQLVVTGIELHALINPSEQFTNGHIPVSDRPGLTATGTSG